MASASPTCNVCHDGVLQSKRVYRMSGIVVAIGWVLLIPSILGILVAILFFLTSVVGGAGAANEISSSRTSMQEADIPLPIQDKVIDEGYSSLTSEDRKALTPEQRQVLAGRAAGQAGVALAGGLGATSSICLGISSFIGGLIGWLLVMKKRILKCTSCGAVVAAS